jgi:hypothetical protein
MTPFQQALIQANEGTLQTPTVSTAGGDINYFGYQLAVHKYNLSLMGMGMKCRGITFTQIKKYYGLKGRTAADCIPQLQYIMEQYKAAMQQA